MKKPQAAPVSEKYGTMNRHDNGLVPGEVVFPVKFIAGKTDTGNTCVSPNEDRSNPVFVKATSVDWFDE